MSAVERRVETTAWSTVALGAVCLLLAALEAAIPILLRRIASVLAAGDTPQLRATQAAFASGVGTSAAVNAAFGVALVAVGLAVSRRARWAHPAMTSAAWASIVLLAAIAKPSLAPVLAVAGRGAGTRALLWGVSGALLLVQIAAVLWFLRFWRGRDVRALFE